MSGELNLSVKVERVWCSKHYRLIPPAVNPITASHILVWQLLKNEEFQILCGRNDETGAKAIKSLAQEKMDEISPVCCFLGDEGVRASQVALQNGRVKID
jgi:hypothetical protein